MEEDNTKCAIKNTGLNLSDEEANKEFDKIDKFCRDFLLYLDPVEEYNNGSTDCARKIGEKDDESQSHDTKIYMGCEDPISKSISIGKHIHTSKASKVKPLPVIKDCKYTAEDKYYDIYTSEHEGVDDTDQEVMEIERKYEDLRSERIKLCKPLPKITITSADGRKSSFKKSVDDNIENTSSTWKADRYPRTDNRHSKRRRITKSGLENVALISNIPFKKMRLLNDAFHTLINLRWRWIVIGTVLVHFAIWFIFALFWYVAALAHHDLDPDPPAKRCVTGGKDFLNIFLASVEAQTTIGFGDRTIDEECPESIFLFIMQLIMGTGISGVLTCVVYAKLTRPENFGKEGVGFSKNAVISMRDDRLCLMFRAWDLNYDHIIGSEIHCYFIKNTRTREGELLNHFTAALPLVQRQLMLWPITCVHVIDSESPLYSMTPEDFMRSHYEIAVNLKGASASMGTYTQSQTSYLPREVKWGYRFASVVKYDNHEQKYTLDQTNLDTVCEAVTPVCSASALSAYGSEERTGREKLYGFASLARHSSYS